MKKIKILLLGFLAVLMVGIVSLASAPITYADTTEEYYYEFDLKNGEVDISDLENYLVFEDILADVDKFIEEDFGLDLFVNDEWIRIYRNGEIFDNDYTDNITIYRDLTEAGNIIVTHDGPNLFIPLKIFLEELKITAPPIDNLTKFRFVVPKEYSNILPEEPGDVITPGGSGTGVPPIVNEKGNITPVYLYSGLIVIALGIGAYVYTLGKNKKGKRK